MYARVVSIQMAPAKVDEAVKLYKDSVVPAARKQKGFKSTRLLVNRKTGKGASITVWDSEASATATGEASAYLQEQIAKFSKLFTAQPVVDTYEVAIDE